MLSNKCQKSLLETIFYINIMIYIFSGDVGLATSATLTNSRMYEIFFTKFLHSNGNFCFWKTLFVSFKVELRSRKCWKVRIDIHFIVRDQMKSFGAKRIIQCFGTRFDGSTLFFLDLCHFLFFVGLYACSLLPTLHHRCWKPAFFPIFFTDVTRFFKQWLLLSYLHT